MCKGPGAHTGRGQSQGGHTGSRATRREVQGQRDRPPWLSRLLTTLCSAPVHEHGDPQCAWSPLLLHSPPPPPRLCSATPPHLTPKSP